MRRRNPIVIWGAGAIGGTIGAFLSRAGHNVVLVDQAHEHVAKIAERGIEITGPIEAFITKVDIRHPTEVREKLKNVLLCVKSQDTRTAVNSIVPHLSKGGYIASFQNGLNEPTITELVGKDRTVGAFINFGADNVSPGVIHYGGRGAVVVGEIDGRKTPRCEYLHILLKDFEKDAILTENIFGFLWSKQAYAILLKASALTHASIAEVLEAPRYREMLTELVKEVVSAAKANGIRLEPFDAFDPEVFQETGAAKLEACYEAMIAYNRRSSKTHSGIWRDIAVRKRPTEVSAQLTPVIRLGRKKGVPMHRTQKLVELFQLIEESKLEQGWQTLDLLLERHESI